MNIKLKNKLILVIGIVVMIIAATAGYFIYQENNRIGKISAEDKRAMTYGEVTEDDKKIEGTDYVQFSAFFARDLNGDGEVEGIKGTCKEVGKEDTLYMELNVLSNGQLKNGKIEINNNNFYLQTAIPKDNEVKDNVVSKNTKTIELNDIKNGTQKLLFGVVRSGDYSYPSKMLDAIGQDINKYSQKNSVTLTGTHVADDGTETNINKTVEFDVDWYGEIGAEFAEYIGNTNYKNQRKDITNVISEDKVNLEFDIALLEPKNELNIQKVSIEGEIPQLNNYDPSKVEVVGEGINFNYDSAERKFSVSKEAELNENNVIIKNAYDAISGAKRYNKFTLKVTYPLEAYEAIAADSIEIKIPVRGNYYGYNNANSEFSNPYKSSTAKDTIVVTFRKPDGDVARFDVKVGTHLYNPTDRYMVSKQKVIDEYDNVADGNEDTYIVTWDGFTGSEVDDNSVMIMKEKKDDNQVSDQFIKNDSSEETMENLVKNIGISFSNPNGILGDDGWIKVYNDETDELLHKFTNKDWNKYTKTQPYKYENPVKHIRIETSKVSKNSSLTVYNEKQIDDNYVVDHFDREYFDNFIYIKSTLTGYIGENYINTDVHQAVYENEMSYVTFNIDKNTLSTQVTENNTKIKINAESNELYNEAKWIDGTFLLKFPKEIIDVEVNELTIDNNEVKVIGHEVYKENDEIFIKILTKNDEPSTYSITLDTNVTPDPRIETKYVNVNLYATNEKCNNYCKKTKDYYDVNNNSNKEEYVGKADETISLIAPNSLLTNQTASGYDLSGNITVAPQIAIVDKNQNSVTMDLSVTNNYANTISEVTILGKVPSTGNKYVINGSDLGSEFDTIMKNTGIIVPSEIQNYVTVYYSENINPTKDIRDENNGWTTKIEECSSIKSFLIDLGQYVIPKGKSLDFKYYLELPNGLNYNKVSYSHHAVYFSLDTDQGKYRTKTEPNKLGVRIAKQYNLQVTKYQKATDIVVEGATYMLVDKDTNEGKIKNTNQDGKIILDNIYVEKTYILKEIKTPDQYELNDEQIEFTTMTDDNGNLIPKLEDESLAEKINLIIGKDDKGNNTVEFKVEDKVRPNLKIVKSEKENNTKIPSVQFKINGKGLPRAGKILSTNLSGEINFVGLYLDEEYQLEETKAKGYYLQKPIKFKVINEDGEYKVNITEGEVNNASVEINNNIPIINLDILNEKAQVYELEILKIEKDDSERNGLQNAKYAITAKDTGVTNYYTTDENGKIKIEDLYQYVEGKNISGEYSLKEVTAPDGYTTSKDIINFKVYKDKNDALKLEVINEDEVTTIREITYNNNCVQMVLEDTPLFVLTKLDYSTNLPLAHAKFAILSVDKNKAVKDFAKDCFGNYVGEYTNGYYLVETDENGKVKLALPGGDYKAVEIIAPEGYEIPTSNEQYFTVYGAIDESLFEINCIEDLVAFSNSVNAGDRYIGKTVTLNESLDFKDDASYKNPNDKKFGDINGDGIVKGIKEELTDTNAKGFIPIGYKYYTVIAMDPISTTGSFSGNFNGKNNKIENLFINREEHYLGLFGHISAANVGNLTVSGTVKCNSKTSESTYVAGIVGYSNTDSSIYNCTNEVNVEFETMQTYYRYVGGLVGYSKGDICNCSNKGNVSGIAKNTDLMIGGITSYVSGKRVIGNYNLGKITAKAKTLYAGGLCGGCSSDMKYSYNKGDITVEATSRIDLGGIAGYSYNILKNSYNIGNIEYTSEGTKNIGYIVGRISDNKEPQKTYYNTYTDIETTNEYGTSKELEYMKTENFIKDLNDDIFGFSSDTENTNDGYPVFNNYDKVNGFKVSEVYYIEDLMKLATYINTEFGNCSEETVSLTRSIDFNDDNSYQNPNDITFEDINGDGVVEGIKNELTKKEGKGFPIIGNSYNYFSGTFEGNGNEIKNLYINTTEMYAGLFGKGTVNNLTVSGELISKFESDTENYSYVGGIVGQGKVNNCQNKVKIIAYNKAKQYSYIGGIVGQSMNNISHCSNFADIFDYSESGNYIGGISGTNYNGSYEINICYNRGNLYSDNGKVGGIASTYKKIKNCYNVGEIHGKTAGYITAYGYGTVTDCYYNSDKEISPNTYKYGTGKNEAEMKTQEFVNLLNGATELDWRYDSNSVNYGYPIYQKEIDYITEINYIEDLLLIAKHVNAGYSYKNINVKLNRTLDFNDDNSYRNITEKVTNFIPIGTYDKPFDGNFDGNNNEILNLNIETNSIEYVGIFGVANGEISNLGVSGRIKTNSKSSYIGGIVGRSSNKIYNCYSNVNLEGTTGKTSFAGGIAGRATNVDKSYFAGNIEINIDEGTFAGKYIGGIAGIGQIATHCYNMGEFNYQNNYNSSRRIKVYIGGIFGFLSGENSNIQRCYNLSDIDIESISENIPIAGQQEEQHLSVGGIVGASSNNSLVKECYNKGNIRANRNITYTGTPTYCWLYVCVGGIEGGCYEYSRMQVLTCYNTGNVEGYCTTNRSDASIMCYSDAIWAYPGSNVKSYTLDSAQIIGKRKGSEPISKTETYMKSQAFVDLLNSYASNANTWRYVENDYPQLNYIEEQESTVADNSVTEINVKNTIKTYKITTEVEKINGVKGGTISGDGYSSYETVNYGNNSIKEIKMIPNNNYEIAEITVNGETYDFETLEDGSFVMPKFIDVKENIHVKVKYCIKENKIVINKIDNETKENITGAKFKIEQVEDSLNKDEAIGGLVDKGRKYATIQDEIDSTDVLGQLTANGNYYFTEEDGKYVSNNTGVRNSAAASYVTVDLRNKEGKYCVVVNAEISSKVNYDYGYVTITDSENVKAYNNYNNTDENLFMAINGVQSAKDYVSYELEGGNIYYLHFGYSKSVFSTSGTNLDKFTINSIKVYTCESNQYNFVENNGKYESTNQNKDNTVANSYIPIDLTKNALGKYKITVNAEISAQSGDYGYVTLTTEPTRVDSTYTYRRMIYITGNQAAKDYTLQLDGGEMYYLHLGYNKNDSGSSGDDKFTINSVKVELVSLYSIEAETNEDGQVVTNIPYGKYNITEIQAPEGYELNSEPIQIDFSENENHELTVENTKKPRIIVHHYIKGTTTKVAEDEEKIGEIGDTYTTYPHLDLENYDLEKDENGKYVIPEKATGVYETGSLEITYYYTNKGVPLRVYHYIQGTNTPVPLQDGTSAKDTYVSGTTGEEYSTSIVENLDNKYTVVSIPENSKGVFGEEEIIVTYYYKLKQYKIETEVKEHEEKDQFNNTIYVEGGDVLGKNEKPYEKVLADENSTKDIITTADKNYVIEGLIVQNIADDGSITEEEVEDAKGQLNYKLNKFENMSSNKKVIVEFSKAKTKLTVHHYLVGTGKEYGNEPIRVPDTEGNDIPDEERELEIGEMYATKEATNLLDKYQLASIPENASGIIDEEPIEVTYYYELKPAKVTVKYLEKGTNEVLATEEVIDGKVDDTYKATKKTIENYTYVEDTENTEGIMTVEPTEVIYYYLPNTSAKVEYIDKTTGKIIEQKEEEGVVGDIFETIAKDFDGYILVEEPEEKSVPMKKEEVVVLRYYYIHIAGGVLEKHIDIISNKILDNAAYEGNEGDEYEILSKEFEGYDLVEDKLPKNSKGTMTVESIEVKYYYIKKAKVEVEHVDILTGKKIAEDDLIEGHENDKYETKQKEIEDYKFVKVSENSKGTMEAETIKVTYYYAPRSAGVIERHIDVTTNELIEKETKYEGYVGDSYKTKEKVFKNYDIVKTKLPKNAEGTMTEEEMIVNYYYLRKAKVIVKYVDKETGKEIIVEDVINGHVGDEYKTKPEDISGYKLVTDDLPGKIKGNMTQEDIVVIYYYEKTAEDNEQKEEKHEEEEKKDNNTEDNQTETEEKQNTQKENQNKTSTKEIVNEVTEQQEKQQVITQKNPYTGDNIVKTVMIFMLSIVLLLLVKLIKNDNDRE